MAGPWEQYQNSNEKGPWEQYAQKPAPVTENPAMSPAAPQTFGHAASEALRAANPLPGLWSAIRHPLDTAKGLYQASADQAAQVVPHLQRGDYSEAAGHALGTIPLIGPGAAAIGEKMGGKAPTFDKYGNVMEPGAEPDLAGGLGAATGMIGSIAAAPALARGAGGVMKAAGRTGVRTALGIPAKAEAWGSNPTEFVLQRTSSVHPSGIASQAEGAVKGLTAEQESAAATSRSPAHLTPARNVVAGDISKAASRNSAAIPRELAPMQEFLTQPRPGFAGSTEFPEGAHTPISFQPTQSPILGPSGQPIAGPPRLIRGMPPEPVVSEAQSPLTTLGMRRQFDTDFIRNWNPTANTKGALGTARKVYHSLGNETDRVIPGGAARDEAIQSGIGARNAAEARALQASLGQRILGRISRPTGGLLPAIIGFHEGGLPGAMLGITGSEAAASPVPLMIGARGAYGAGRAVASPFSQRAAQVAPLLKRPQQ